MDEIRIGLFTSSQIYRLMGAPKPMATYIQEKQWERDLGINIQVETSSHPLSWGRIMEGYVYENHIEIEYELSSQQTTLHEYELWCGTKDLKKDNCIADIKCPSSRLSFCSLSDVLLQQDIELFKKEYPEYYWQLVSNSVLEKVDNAELIVWMPYPSEHEGIIEYIEGIDNMQDQLDIQWVMHAPSSRLPFIPEGRKYKNIVRFAFEVPVDEKTALEEKVYDCSRLFV